MTTDMSISVLLLYYCLFILIHIVYYIFSLLASCLHSPPCGVWRMVAPPYFGIITFTALRCATNATGRVRSSEKKMLFSNSARLISMGVSP